MKNTRIYTYFNKRLFQPLLKILREGITPHKLALTIVFGVGFGLIPILGATTVFCLLFAFILRLNKPAILLINLFVYPLQLLLYIPFIKIGEYLFGLGLTSLTIRGLIDMFRDDWLATIREIWFHNLLGIFAWLLIMLPISFLIYYVSLPIFRKALKKHTG